MIDKDQRTAQQSGNPLPEETKAQAAEPEVNLKRKLNELQTKKYSLKT